LSAQMRTAWTGFATDGDPGWASYDTGLVQLFDVAPTQVPYPERVSSQIWQDHPRVLDLPGS
jgi:para-nitrobenzyl esterase